MTISGEICEALDQDHSLICQGSPATPVTGRMECCHSQFLKPCKILNEYVTMAGQRRSVRYYDPVG